MPYRDCEATIALALGSVLAQVGAPDFEVLAIDDGSRDQGPAIVGRVAKSDARVRPVHLPGVGIARALCAGLEIARGSFIARMDGDDVCHPDRLRKQMDALVAQPEVAVMGSAVRAGPPGAVARGLQLYVAWQNRLLTPADHRREIFVEAPLCHPSTLIRREVLDRVGAWRDIDGPEDYDLWLRVDQAGLGMAKVDAVLLDWRQRPGRATFVDQRYHKSRFVPLKAPYLAARIRSMGRKLVVWGAGPTGKRTARALEREGVFAEYFVDVGPDKRVARGRPVRRPEELRRGDALIVVAVAARGAREQIRGDLSGRGFREGEDFLFAA